MSQTINVLQVVMPDARLVDALRELAKQFLEAWPDHTGKYHFLIGAGHEIAKAAPPERAVAGWGVILPDGSWSDVQATEPHANDLAQDIGQELSPIPSGWHLEQSGDRIVVRAPDGSGYAAERAGDSGIAESVLYMLADALLSAAAIQSES